MSLKRIAKESMSPFMIVPASLCFALVLVLIVFFLNRGSEQAFEILKPFGIAFAVALGYVFTRIVPPPASENESFQVSIFSKPGPEFLRLTGLPAESFVLASQVTYDRVWRYAFSEPELLDWQGSKPPTLITKKRPSEDELKSLKKPEHEFYLDLLQLGFFEWMRNIYRSHWDLEVKRYEGFGGVGVDTTP